MRVSGPRRRQLSSEIERGGGLFCIGLAGFLSWNFADRLTSAQSNVPRYEIINMALQHMAAKMDGLGF